MYLTTTRKLKGHLFLGMLVAGLVLITEIMACIRPRGIPPANGLSCVKSIHVISETDWPLLTLHKTVSQKNLKSWWFSIIICKFSRVFFLPVNMNLFADSYIGQQEEIEGWEQKDLLYIFCSHPSKYLYIFYYLTFTWYDKSWYRTSYILYQFLYFCTIWQLCITFLVFYVV